MSVHGSHPDVIKRLKRAQGHLQSVITMLEAERGCLDIAQQLQAVETAITNAKRTLVYDHIEHCLHRAVEKSGRRSAKTLAEFKEITKYL